MSDASIIILPKLLPSSLLITLNLPLPIWTIFTFLLSSLMDARHQLEFSSCDDITLLLFVKSILIEEVFV
jgi:hypothetical protein